MNWNLKEALQSLAKEEQGAVYKRQGIPIALMYPNSYYVGMSNLGLHIIYKEINNRSDSYCERVFMPDKKDLAEYERSKTPLMSVETQRPLNEFSVIGIAITFEMDYFHIPTLLRMGRVPVYAKDRTDQDAFVISGGPCSTFNPEPFSAFMDACIIGEGEEVIHNVLDVIHGGRSEGLSRREILFRLAQLESVYVPSFYEPQYDGEDHFIGYKVAEGVPKTVKRAWAELTSPGETVVVTDDTEFGGMYIVEVARGCGRHCRFCMAGYVFRKPRVRTLEELKEGVHRAAVIGKKVGLMGAAISDYPQIDELVRYMEGEGIPYSCASLRADSLTLDVVEGLARSGQKTITIAPEAGSERLRRVVNKGITDEHLMRAVSLAAEAGLQHVRLYIMIGLPTETEEDIDAIVSMAIALQNHMKEVGVKGKLTLSVNPFIPKPSTPFQWMAVEEQKLIETKLSRLKKALQKQKGIEVLAESPKEAYIQAVLARGDRRVGEILQLASEEGEAKSFLKVCKRLGFSVEEELYRERRVDEILPWSHLDMHLKDDYLAMEWKRSVEEAYTVPCMDGCRRCGVCGGRDE